MPRDHGWQVAVAADLDTLAALHDREIDTPMLAALRRIGFPRGLILDTPEASRAVRCLDGMLHALSLPMTDTEKDEMAAAYADVFLVNGCGCSPCASPWLDKDGLMRQQPMLEVAALYGRHQLRVESRQLRPDDHLATLLSFAAFLLRSDGSETGLAALRDFLAAHVCSWLPAFAETLARRDAPPFYRDLAAVTAAYADNLRNLATGLTATEHAATAP